MLLGVDTVMSDFINTTDVLGDDAVTDGIIQRTIAEFNSNQITTIGDNAFSQCTSLKSANSPTVKTITSGAFYGCTTLGTVDLSSIEEIGPSAFYNCSKLVAFIIRKTNSLCVLGNNNAFQKSPIGRGSYGVSSLTGYIYVPSALMESYQAATNWSKYASSFRAIEDYPEICG